MSYYNAYVLVPGDVKDIDDRVSEMMAPYSGNIDTLPYPRECDCVYGSAIEKLKAGQYAMNGRVKAGLIVEFTKTGFAKNGPEIVQKLELLRLGNPNPTCEECGGSGILYTTHNCRTEWDSWEIVPVVTEAAFKDCISPDVDISPDQESVPVEVLDIKKVPTPRAVITPDGTWHARMKSIWGSNAAIVDEDWDKTVNALLQDHKDATFVVVNCHI